VDSSLCLLCCWSFNLWASLWRETKRKTERERKRERDLEASLDSWGGKYALHMLPPPTHQEGTINYCIECSFRRWWAVLQLEEDAEDLPGNGRRGRQTLSHSLWPRMGAAHMFLWPMGTSTSLLGRALIGYRTLAGDCDLWRRGARSWIPLYVSVVGARTIPMINAWFRLIRDLADEENKS
jgi:hypothetical protein